MNQVRTTISLDAQLHKQLLLQAVSLGVTFSELVNTKLVNKNTGLSQKAIGDSVNADMAFFKTFGRKMGRTNWVKAVRKERDRDKV